MPDGRERMNYFGKINQSSVWVLLVFFGVFQLNFIISWSLNDEGIALLRFRERVISDPFGALSSWNEEAGETNHCLWFGIECAHGHVVSLKLKNLRLEGTLTPELCHLLHIKSIILRNNSFSGLIPEEIKHLKELELLDLSHNKFSKPLRPEIGYNFPISDNGWTRKAAAHPRMLAEKAKDSAPAPKIFHNLIPSPALLPKLIKHQPQPQPRPRPQRPREVNNLPPKLPPPSPTTTSNAIPPPPSSVPSPFPSLDGNEKTKNPTRIVLGAMGGFAVFILVIVGIYLCKSNKIATVGPWKTGLSGQLQKAFVTGIPNLKRSELEAACEDFSNVVGSSSIGTIYKGTLSNEVEIAVISLAVTSAKDWSRNLETQFRRKIETLSKVNHKNFVNLIGYCEEKEPFTRMMVFEYAPNGSLFEHLHVKEAEHLDWGMRLRVATGISYCLEHMHELVPPITHPNLNSSAVTLSEDYAAKLCNFCFWNEVAASAQVQPIGMGSLSTSSATPESNVYSFALILLEMVTGQIPLSLENSSLEGWVSDYLRGDQHLQEWVDPMLRHFDPEQLERVDEVIRKCLHVDPEQRPGMKEVAARVREITGIDRDKASPRLSPLWWAELEVISANGE